MKIGSFLQLLEIELSKYFVYPQEMMYDTLQKIDVISQTTDGRKIPPKYVLSVYFRSFAY